MLQLTSKDSIPKNHQISLLFYCPNSIKTVTFISGKRTGRRSEEIDTLWFCKVFPVYSSEPIMD